MRDNLTDTSRMPGQHASSRTGRESGILKRLTMGVVLLALPMVVAACGMGETTSDGYENVSVEQVHKHIMQGEASPIPFMLIDVRTPEEYKTGHIAGARLMPVNRLKDFLSDIPKDKQVYVYCLAGGRSAQAAKFLAAHGYTRIENMLGGIQAWKNAGYEVVKQ